MNSLETSAPIETPREGVQGVVEEVGGGPGPAAHAVSVIIPALDEAEHVAAEIEGVDRYLRSTDWSYEILVVDDGSSDETADRAAAAGARVLRHRNNRGYGASLKTGIANSRFDWILITDADGTYPAEEIPRLLAVADRNAMVVGARTGAEVAVPFSRKPAKWLLRKLAGYLAGQRLPDLNSGLRLMRRDLIERYQHLLPDGFSFTTTITLAAACNGHEVEYVSINYRRRLGESKIRPRHAFEFTLLILRTVVFFNPLKVFLPLGGLLALGGLAKFGYDLTRNNLSESAVLAFMAALVVWAVGLLADQNARIAMHRQ